MYNVRLIKVISTHDNLRTDEVVGLTHSLPEVGQPFILTGDPLSKSAHVRIIHTTPVIKMDETNSVNSGTIVFETVNSVYRLHYIKERNEYVN